MKPIGLMGRVAVGFVVTTLFAHSFVLPLLFEDSSNQSGDFYPDFAGLFFYRLDFITVLKVLWMRLKNCGEAHWRRRLGLQFGGGKSR